ncbi:DUF3037 domain-containing protein [Rubinisphaera sp. JC750]|uniref:DUF3037 domain-containing protein n=1 Tax=Rubinisphaera sp. JC750 TaxID=2898658 RepID=UPI001F1B9D1D|nr:DUF3037 domain-containing protein [Rubinisphaera sp. JC750]
MKPQKGYYSVIQYCPDLSRFEAVNIGVLLFCPDSGFLKARIGLRRNRISHVFGKDGHDWERLKAVKQSLQKRFNNENSEFRSIDDLQHFIATRANQIQLTPPKFIKVFNPVKDLDELYEKMAGAPSSTPRGPALRTLLAREFDRPELASKIVSNVKVEVPILDKEVEMPFGYQNGRFNLITPVRFSGQNQEEAFGKASRWAIEGQSIFNARDSRFGKLQLIVVGQFAENRNTTIETVKRVLDPYQVKLFPFDSVDNLVQDILINGKDQPHATTA